MKCSDVCARLTAYLDGELEGDLGSAVRGHLRGCEACRTAAGEEAVLRDELRALPPLDPPSSLWAGVQAKLAEAEIADAERPAWRRSLTRLLPRSPQLGLAGAALAVAIAVLVWRERASQTPAVAERPTTTPTTPPPCPAPKTTQDTTDVSVELVAAAACQTQDYANAAAELLQLAGDARARWSDDRKQAFDARVAELRKQIDGAAEMRPRQRAYRALIRYLQSAAVRGDVALADAAFGGHR
jgi:hypothetical protein